MDGEALAESGAGQQLVGAAFEGICSRVGEIFLQQGGPGRQAGEVEGEAADQLLAAGLGRGSQGDGLEAFGDQQIGGQRGCSRQTGRTPDRLVGPVLLIFRALGNPLADQLLLVVAEGLVRVRWRHDFIWVSGEDAFHRFRLLRLAGDDGVELGVGVQWRDGVGEVMQLQLGLDIMEVGAVAVKAGVRKDRPDVLVELDLVGQGW